MTDWSSEEEKYEGSLNHFDIKLRTTLTCDTIHTERITKAASNLCFPEDYLAAEAPSFFLFPVVGRSKRTLLARYPEQYIV